MADKPDHTVASVIYENDVRLCCAATTRICNDRLCCAVLETPTIGNRKPETSSNIITEPAASPALSRHSVESI